MSDFKDRIKELRESNDFTFQQFANKVNALDGDGAKMSKSSVYDMEIGKREPGYKTIVKIAKAFNVSTDWLLGISDLKGAADDDINLAAQTTGLEAETIKELSELRKHEKYDDYKKTIYNLVHDLYITYLDYSEMFEGEIEKPDPKGYLYYTALDCIRRMYKICFKEIREYNDLSIYHVKRPPEYSYGYIINTDSDREKLSENTMPLSPMILNSEIIRKMIIRELCNELFQYLCREDDFLRYKVEDTLLFLEEC